MLATMMPTGIGLARKANVAEMTWKSVPEPVAIAISVRLRKADYCKQIAA
jgi:hypothetical protein